MKQELSYDYLRSVLDYDPASGEFRWRKKLGSRAMPGCRAGTRRKKRGEWAIKVHGTRYEASRLAWLYVMGEWPDGQVDHIDVNPGNNAWSNLRAASQRENLCNRGAQKNNKLGVKGVHAHIGRRGRVTYKAQISVSGKTAFIGRFERLEDARAAYIAAAAAHQGPFAHG